MFSERSIWTMVHGIVLSGAALMGMAAALFHLYTLRSTTAAANPHAQSRAFAQLTVFIAIALWLAVLIGTYIIFPEYRATPPEGTTDLTQYPRALILADPANAWLHSFAMEIKEHVPWIAAMMATAVAAVSVRYRARLPIDTSLRRMCMTFLMISLVLVAFAGLLGTFINKFAPLE